MVETTELGDEKWMPHNSLALKKSAATSGGFITNSSTVPASPIAAPVGPGILMFSIMALMAIVRALIVVDFEGIRAVGLGIFIGVVVVGS